MLGHMELVGDDSRDKLSVIIDQGNGRPRGAVQLRINL